MQIHFITSLKPFNENSEVIQNNSINSWKWLGDKINIHVFNKDESIKKFCLENSLNYVDEYECSEFSDLPTWRGMKNGIYDILNNDDIIIWVNGDIIFDQTLISHIEFFKNSESFVLSGMRKDWDDWFLLENKSDLEKIESLLDKRAIWAIDYLVFKKNNFNNLPLFYIARMKFDTFLLHHSIQSYYTIDCTETLNVIHHTHKYGKNVNYETFHELLDNQSNFRTEMNINEQNCNNTANYKDCRFYTIYDSEKNIQVKNR